MVKLPELTDRFARLCYDSAKSDAKIAEALGASTLTVFKWRTGKAEPRAFYIMLICKYFNVSADWLLGIK
jgi:transcriptional regulator with XRE-family HTH domain